MREFMTRATVAFGVCLLALGLYAGTLRFGFTLDDPNHLGNETAIASPSAVHRAFTTPTWPGNLYRPLLGASIATTYRVVGREPWAYHLTNVALYGTTVACIAVLLTLVLPLPRAAVAAALFAVHPIHVEVVANVSHRTELFAALFGCLALIVSIERSRPAAPWAASAWATLLLFLLFLLAFLSKESALAFVLLVPFVVVASGQFAEERRRALKPFCVALASAVTYLSLRWIVLGPAAAGTDPPLFLVNPLAHVGTETRVLSSLTLLGKYLALCFVPWPLSSDYSFAKTTAVTAIYGTGSLAYLSLLVLVLVSSLIGAFWRSVHWLWGVWFCLSFSITSNLLFPIGTAFAERLAFLPSLAVCGLITDWVFLCRSRALRAVLVGALAVLGMLGTVVQASYWASDETLRSREVEVVPESARAQQNFATVCMNKGQFQRAQDHLRRALQIYPAYAGAAFRMFQCFDALEMPDEADRWLDRTLAMEPDHPSALAEKGWILVERGAFAGAELAFNDSLRSMPRGASAKLGLFAVAVSQGNRERAETLRNELRQLHPDPARLKIWTDRYLAKGGSAE